MQWPFYARFIRSQIGVASYNARALDDFNAPNAFIICCLLTTEVVGTSKESVYMCDFHSSTAILWKRFILDQILIRTFLHKIFHF